MEKEKEGFRFPRRIIFCGRFLTAKRIARRGNDIVCLYEDDELGVSTSFTEIQFKYNERYGYIERRWYDKG